jgi:hypothetical protein
MLTRIGQYFLGGSSAISGGRDESGSGSTANHYIVGNLFYDVDHAVKAKDGNFHVIAHNTVVRVTPEGGIDTDCGMLGCGDVGYPESLGHYLQDNISMKFMKLCVHNDSSILTSRAKLMNGALGARASRSISLGRAAAITQPLIRLRLYSEARRDPAFPDLGPGADHESVVLIA